MQFGARIADPDPGAVLFDQVSCVPFTVFQSRYWGKMHGQGLPLTSFSVKAGNVFRRRIERGNTVLVVNGDDAGHDVIKDLLVEVEESVELEFGQCQGILASVRSRWARIPLSMAIRKKVSP